MVFLGAVSAEDKARYYKSADIYCSPATGRESFGIVLLEAMAAGTAVVASDIEGYSSVLNNGSDGLLVRPKDEAQLSAALNMLLTQPDYRNRLAATARKKVERFRWEEVAGEVLDHYGSLLERPAAISL